MVLVYTWVHGLVFCLIGGVASRLLALAERNLNLGFGILLLFVIFEFGFVGAAFIFAEPVLHALTWPAILIGNLLAAAAMAALFLASPPQFNDRTLTVHSHGYGTIKALFNWGPWSAVLLASSVKGDTAMAIITIYQGASGSGGELAEAVAEA